MQPNKKITIRWLTAEMDRRVKQMLKLIDEDADTFAKKVDMYYQKRPELVAHVEEFYRLYRTLVERNHFLSGELRKNTPSELQSQGSGISDIGSEAPSAWPSPDQRQSRPPRAAGFEFFLGSGWSNSDVCLKEGDESSYITDSEPDSDDSSPSTNNDSVLSTNVGDQGASRKSLELEIELREAKEKLRAQEEDNTDCLLSRGTKNENCDLFARIGKYEEELKIANKKLQLSEEKINWLSIELQKYKQRETSESESSEEELPNRISVADNETIHDDGNIQPLDSEKEIACLKLENKQAYETIQNLQAQLDSAQREISTCKYKLDIEKNDVNKLQGRIIMLKDSLSSRDHEIRDLKIAVSDAELKILPEKVHIEAEVSKLLEERNCLEKQLREWESHARSLEEEIRNAANEKEESEDPHDEIEPLKAEIAKRDGCIKILNEDLESLKSERDELKAKIDSLEEEVSYMGDRIVEMDKRLQQLYMERMELIASAEGAHKSAEEIRSRTKELEDEIERQRIEISEGAEEKREAIRQLCFSIEYYKDEYDKLLQEFNGNKRAPVLAT